MRSSTFSSSGRVPAGRWGGTWLLALLVVVPTLLGWELFWRSRGFAPSLRDNAELWAMSRSQASDRRSDILALVGSSRLQADVNPDLLSRVTGKSVVQLAITGANALPVLQDLASDDDFRGDVLFEVNPLYFFDTLGEARMPALGYVAQFHGSVASPSARIEQFLSIQVHDVLLARLPALNPYYVYRGLRSGRWPKPTYLRMASDRSVTADYRYFALENPRGYRRHIASQLRFYRDELRPCAPAQVPQIVRSAEIAIDKILAKGGRVAYVRFPSGGGVRFWEGRRVPRAYYWDVLARSTRAYALHAEDAPALSSFDFPDGSHIDGSDRDRFTRSLVSSLTPWLDSGK